MINKRRCKMNNEWKELRLENLHEILGGGKDVRLKGCTATIILSIGNLTLMCSGMSNGVFNYEYRPKPKTHDDLARQYAELKYGAEARNPLFPKRWLFETLYNEAVLAFIAGRKSME